MPHPVCEGFVRGQTVSPEPDGYVWIVTNHCTGFGVTTAAACRRQERACYLCAREVVNLAAAAVVLYGAGAEVGNGARQWSAPV